MYIVSFLLTSLLAAACRAFALPSNVRSSAQDESVKKPTLQQVNLVLRHGSRSPQSTYTNDPYKNDFMEPFGWGQLTRDGRLNQYQQGLYLRERYGEFLGSKYSPAIFWLQSTAADRAKMSALLEAAALWQPDEQQAFLADLPWQPVTMTYQTVEKDDLLLIWESCPDYGRAREATEKLPEIQNINEQNKRLYENLTKFTGDKINSPDKVFDLYSTLESEKLGMNFKLPEWSRDYFPEKLIPLSKLSLKMNVYDESMLKMKAAPLITTIVTNMGNKADGNLIPQQRKMFMYVGHDSTVVTFLEGLKIWDTQIPSYGIMTMIELHKDDQGWNVQIYLRNSTEHNPYPLTIPGCSFACPLEKLKSLLQPMIISKQEWKNECALKDANYKPGKVPLP